MSKLSDDITGAILKMTADLNEFNRTFAENTKELKETLSTVNDNYEGQVKLLDAIEKLKITKIAKANIEVYDRLQGCTDELEKLFEILSDSESYIAKVTELNNNIGSIEERTRLFEELGTYFKNEIEYVKDRQGYMRQQMSGLDSVLQDALSNLGDNLTHSLQQLTTVFQSQNQRIQELIESQQNELTSSLMQQQREVNEKIGQIDNPFAGLKETFDAGIQSITSAFASQNTAIEEMLSSQKRLVEESLKTQQEAILQKFKDSPSQLQALSDIAKTLEKLNSKLSNLNTTNVENKINGATKKSKLDWIEKYNKILLPIGMVGTFLSLLALIAIILCK
jgi:ABC-type transporter Mla subunit MlaD